MNPNAKITDEQFEAYLKQIRELAEGPFEEMQKEIEVTNTFPEEFYELSKKNDLYRYYLPSEYGGWDLNELEILKVQEEFSRGPGGMRMHLHHAADMNWRILEDYGKPELKAQLIAEILGGFQPSQSLQGDLFDAHGVEETVQREPRPLEEFLPLCPARQEEYGGTGGDAGLDS